MEQKRGVPKDVLDKLNIRKKEKQIVPEVTIVVEAHQAKIPIPASVRREIEFKDNQRCKIIYDANKKEIICKLI